MTRNELIEQILRQVYGEQPTDDASITPNLVNIYINQGVALAAKQNYKDAIQLDGWGYVNNSFYSTFSGSTITVDNTDQFQYYITLPQVPLGIGNTEGITSLQFKYGNEVSYTAIPMSMNQVGYVNNLRAIPNKLLFFPEGNLVRIKTPLILDSGYTWTAKLVSGGDSTNLNSNLNCPDDYIPLVVDYCMKLLMLERNQPKDTSNDGADNR